MICLKLEKKICWNGKKSGTVIRKHSALCIKSQCTNTVSPTQTNDCFIIHWNQYLLTLPLTHCTYNWTLASEGTMESFHMMPTHPYKRSPYPPIFFRFLFFYWTIDLALRERKRLLINESWKSHCFTWKMATHQTQRPALKKGGRDEQLNKLNRPRKPCHAFFFWDLSSPNSLPPIFSLNPSLSRFCSVLAQSGVFLLLFFVTVTRMNKKRKQTAVILLSYHILYKYYFTLKQRNITLFATF